MAITSWEMDWETSCSFLSFHNVPSPTASGCGKFNSAQIQTAGGGETDNNIYHFELPEGEMLNLNTSTFFEIKSRAAWIYLLKCWLNILTAKDKVWWKFALTI